MLRLTTLFILVILNGFAFSQLKQILVLNEGAYDYQNNQVLVPVSIGSFDPVNSIYLKKNEIADARFATDIVIDGATYWVAADKYLVQYDLISHQKLNEHQIEGIRKIAFYKDYIIITRGEYLKTLSAYVQIFNKKTFELKFEIPFADLPYTTENIIIKDDFAYVAVNNGFDFGKEVGKIIKVDLTGLKVLETIELGNDGKNPENLMLKDNLLVSLNNKDFTGSSVSVINSQSSEVTTYNLSNVGSFCGTSALFGEQVIYQEFGKTDLGSFEISSKQIGFLKNPGISYYGIAYDPKSKWLCAAETDFRTTGKVYIYDADFNQLYTFDAGITPGFFAFDHSGSVATGNPEELEFKIFSNPVLSELNISSNETIEELQILDLFGRVILKSNKLKLDLGQIQVGQYILMAKAKDKLGYKRFVKL